MRRIWNQSGRGGFVILLADRPLGEKRVSRGLSIVAVILCGLVALPLLYVDSLAKDALESGASESFGTKTTLGSVSLGLVSGKVGLAKLRVRNPEGFDARYFFSIRKGRFAVGLPAFLDEEVEVPELVLEDVELALQRGGGTSNYDVILAHMRSRPPPDPDDPGKRFVIRDLRIRNVRADLRLDGPAGVGKTLAVAIPEIRLRDVGSDTEGGLIASQLWGTVMRAVLVAIVREGGGVAGFITRDLAGGLGRLGAVPIEVLGQVTRVGGGAVGAGQAAGELAGQAAGGLGDAAGGLIGAGEDAGKTAGDAVRRGLGGLLDRKD